MTQIWTQLKANPNRSNLPKMKNQTKTERIHLSTLNPKNRFKTKRTSFSSIKKLTPILLSTFLFFNSPSQANETVVTEEPLTQKFVRELIENFMEELKSNQSEEGRIELTRRYILPVVDKDKFARLTLGKYRTDLSEEEYKNFRSNLLIELSETYAKFTNYLDRIANIKYSTEHKEKYDVVKLQLYPHGDVPTNIDLMMIHQKEENTYLIFDIKIEGTSLAIQRRNSHHITIKERGIEAFIESFQDMPAK